MENKKEITSEQYAEKILEIAYHDFPLVHPKETVLRVINALLLEYAALKQQESDAVDEDENLRELISMYHNRRLWDDFQNKVLNKFIIKTRK